MVLKKDANPVSAILGQIKKVAGGVYKETRNKEAEVRGASLPAGVVGVAKFTSWKLGKVDSGKNKGAPFLTLTGVVVSPKEFNGLPIAGSQVRKTITIVDGKKDPKSKDAYTPKTAKERYEEALNNVKLIGGDDILKDTTDDDLPDILNNMVEEETMFKFHTWEQPARGNYKAAVRTDFDGHAKDFSEEDVSPVEEEEEEEESTEEEETSEEETSEEEESSEEETTEDSEEEETSEEEESAEEEESEDSEEESEEQTITEEELTALGVKADKNDKKAKATLSELAESNGVDTDKHKSWKAVAKALLEVMSSESEEQEEEEQEEESQEEEWQPAKEDTVNYKPKGAKKSIECEVTAVLIGKQTANLKDLASGKIFKGVAWSELTPTE